MESQHFDGGQFADTLGHVQIRQIVQDHHRQHHCDDDQYFHDLIERFHDRGHHVLLRRVLHHTLHCGQFHESRALTFRIGHA